MLCRNEKNRLQKLWFLAFPGGPGGFRELREAGRNHFHLSWYLFEPGVTSYGQKTSWGDFFLPSTVYIYIYIYIEPFKGPYDMAFKWPYIPGTVKKSPPRVFGHNSLPRTLTGTRIGGNASYQPPGAP